jgi:thymidine kinase
MTSPQNRGELHIIIGPMFSSKTTTLISKLDRHTFGQTVLAINHELDTRYSMEGLRTHDGKSFPCLRARSLSSVYSNPLYQTANVIGIDESQFFDDLVPNVKIMVETHNKIVYVAGLNGSYRRELFGTIHELIPWADTVQLLSAVCMECNDGKTPGIFSKLITKKTESGNVFIGGSAEYKAVCRKHF